MGFDTMTAMTFACTPSQTSHAVNGGVTGTKRRRRSRRGEPLCDSTIALKLDSVGEPLCRRPRLGPHPPASPRLQSKTPATLECLLAQAAQEEAARKAQEAAKAAAIEAVRKAEELAKVQADKAEVAKLRQIAKQMQAEAEEAARKATEAEVVANKAEETSLLRNLKTVIINMERRPDRLEGCVARLQTIVPELRHERLPAVDGRLTPIGQNLSTSSWDTTENVVYQRVRSIRKGWDDLHTYHERVLDLSPGERGCAASHINAWRRCLAMDSEEPLLVLEDDAAPMPDFGGILRRALSVLPSDAGILYLGYSQAAEWRRELSPELVEAEYVWTTVGYMIWPSAARLLLSQLPINQPVDNWMANLCAKGQLKSYAIRPKLIRQSDAWNCGSDIRHSDENYWGPDSDIIHSEVAPAPPAQSNNSLERAIPGAIIEDGSSFWDLSGGEQVF